ncbi:MAG TPA: carbamoyltransferase C-terminal domain-containing protein [Streptosporangiaceae bacterium]|nr:carbamoyltransferase C-terminal domain-containing protein [Streptosporangiaceae bacterium]
MVEDGVIRAALGLERTTRVKRGTVPVHAYSAAMADLTGDILTSEGLAAADIDYWIATSTESRNDADEARLASILGLLVPPERTVHLPHPGHHLAHASAAFYASGFDEAAALVIDAYGSLVGSRRERESGFCFRSGTAPERVLQVLRDSERAGGSVRDGEIWLPADLNGVGEVYRVITLALGFRETGTIYDDAGKTMGLASYGKRLSQDNLFIQIASEGGLSFDPFIDSLVELGLAVRCDDEIRLITRQPKTPFEQFHYDLAAQVQAEFEDAVMHLARQVLSVTGSRSLVAAGGSFLNSTLNTRLLNEIGIDRLFVFPAATDDGNAAGAALYAYHNLTAKPAQAQPSPPLRHVYLGPSRIAGRDLMPLAERWHLPARRHAGADELAAAAAAAISRGEIIGWFGDRGEYGPRALGARSILCHPGIAGMRDKLNARVKFREAFRPFAGSVLAEHAAQWFEMPADESPFMLLVCPVIRPGPISEVVHVDGTCRIQTVAADTPGLFRAVIEAFMLQSGLPLVLNTSFNLRGMPIVERPEEAIDCLYGSRLDRLFIGDLEIMPPDLPALRPERTTATTTSGGILELADGTLTMADLAEQLACEVSDAVDLALELRRRGLLRWAGVPEVAGPAYAPLQYLPDGLTDP